MSASFTYDGDGNRVKGVVGSLATTYIGNYFEWTGSTDTMKRYYYAGSVRVAVKTGGSPDQNPVLNWLFGDHLGSTSRAANANGTALFNGELRYKAWGEKRFPEDSSAVPTTYRYTGQRQEALLGGLDGLYFYNARWYDPALSRFIQPDTTVPNPGDPRAWDRFAYVLNNPLKYIDPTGHTSACGFPWSDPECSDNDGSTTSNGGGTNGGGNNGGTGSGGSSTVWGQQGGLPLPSPLKGRQLYDYELNLLTIATYAESSNYSWSDESAIEMIVWVYLNRVALHGYTVLGAIQGKNCWACLDLASPAELNNEVWVSQYIQDALAGEMYGNAWEKAQNMVATVAEKWSDVGTGSVADPTNGSTFFYVAKDDKWGATFKKYERITVEYPTFFRWSASDIFIWGGEFRIVFTRTQYPPGFK